jgi:hypothetical protein
MMDPDPEGVKGGSYHEIMIKLKRVYDPPEAGDGARILVERLWPRGIKKEALILAAWSNEVAPSQALRRWFGHDPAKWDEFRQLLPGRADGNPVWQPFWRLPGLAGHPALQRPRQGAQQRPIAQGHLEGQLDGVSALSVA